MHIIGGSKKNKAIVSPSGLNTRPTSARLRESLFNICQGYIEGARFLDLYAGSGAMGLEALSRGATAATFVDIDKAAIQSIKKNLELLAFSNLGRIYMGDTIVEVGKLIKQRQQFDIIYIDPPYDSIVKINNSLTGVSAHLLQLVDESSLLASEGMLFIEESKDAKPKNENLKTLVLQSSRNLGRSTLQQYKKIS